MEGGTIVEQLQQAIRESGMSLAGIARLCGVDHPRLSRFVRGERALSLASAAKVCVALGLRLVKAEPSKTRQKKSPTEGKGKAGEPRKKELSKKKRAGDG